eukprot:COSAG06_NODE_5810_length_3261_cov_21.125000_2_plen_89_part_00
MNFNVNAQERQEALEMWLEGVFSSDAATPRPPAPPAAAAADGGVGGGVEVSRAEARFYEFLTAQDPAAAAGGRGGAAGAGGGAAAGHR